MKELTCQELVELITDYLEAALSPLERRRFEEHLQICEGCQAYIAQMRETIRLTGRLTVKDVSPDAEAKLVAVFRDWHRGSSGGRYG